jgi:outer membrane autotransporter protein
MGPIDLDFIGGLGAGKMQSRRFVEIGEPVAFSAFTEADWMAYEGHGSIRASVPLAISELFTVTPQAALTYVGISEGAYEETGGGAAVDYQVDSVFSQRLWADVGVELAANLHFGSDTIISPRIYAGYRANTLDAEAERTVAFASTGTQFTLTDEGVGDGGPLVGIGFDATNGYSTFSLGYEGEFSDQIERHSINAAIRFRF